MTRTLYFADKTLLITDTAEVPADFFRMELAAGQTLSKAKVLKIFENHRCAAVVCTDTDATFEAFAARFTPVEAAGGVVRDAAGRSLMIFRNGRWDLPKGHVEAGERIEDCAVREVEEETGACEIELGSKLCETVHCYRLGDRWEMKRTHWFAMTTRRTDTLSPQREEGIVRAVWCTPSQVASHLKGTFPTIRRVMECLDAAGRAD